jgi:hypothetical protein
MLPLAGANAYYPAWLRWKDGTPRAKPPKLVPPGLGHDTLAGHLNGVIEDRE